MTLDEPVTEARTEGRRPLRIELQPTATGSRCVIRGALTSQTAAELRAANILAEAGCARHLHLDLAALTDLDLPGLGSLLGVIRAAREAYVAVSISATARIRQLLVWSGVDRLVQIGDRLPVSWAVATPPAPAAIAPGRRRPYPDPFEPWA